MSTIAVVEVITLYLMTFGSLLGDIKIGFINFSLDRLSIINKHRVSLEKHHLIDPLNMRHQIGQGVARIYKPYKIFEDILIFSFKIVLLSVDNKDYELDLKEISFDRSSPLGALGRRFESCRPDHLKTNSYQREVPKSLFYCKNKTIRNVVKQSSRIYFLLI